MKRPKPDPRLILDAWRRLSPLPFGIGKKLFSRFVGAMAPYTGTIGATVLELAPGFAQVQLRDRRRVRNHLSSIHAVALMNLGELVTGVAMMSALPPGSRGIVTDLAMTYLKKARGTLLAEARVDPPQSAGKHDLQVVGSIRDAAGDLVAQARATWRVDIPQNEGRGR
ncbi:MAG: DUF4442 domain-containing protein [Nannocystis sp.]|nr:DUF4442 domain-containing protein [Nannocystis sp.]